jgi:hypothetical protein
MGTRHLTVIKDFDGVVKVAQYGQWDGYPDGQGLVALDALTNYTTTDIAMGLNNCRWIEQSELETIVDLYCEQSGYMTLDQSKKFSEEHPSLSRDTGADIINLVCKSATSGESIPLQNDYEFKDDDLYCEGVYEVDLSTNEFISWFNGTKVKFNLDELPSPSKYVEAFNREMASQ